MSVSCVAVRPCTWVDVRADNCPVVRLPSVASVSPASWLAVRPSACVVVSACRAVAPRAPSEIVVRAPTCVEVRGRELCRRQVGERRRREGRDLSHRQGRRHEGLQAGGRHVGQLRRGQAMHLGRPSEPTTARWSGCRASRRSARRASIGGPGQPAPASASPQRLQGPSPPGRRREVVVRARGLCRGQGRELCCRRQVGERRRREGRDLSHRQGRRHEGLQAGGRQVGSAASRSGQAMHLGRRQSRQLPRWSGRRASRRSARRAGWRRSDPAPASSSAPAGPSPPGSQARSWSGRRSGWTSGPAQAVRTRGSRRPSCRGWRSARSSATLPSGSAGSRAGRSVSLLRAEPAQLARRQGAELGRG